MSDPIHDAIAQQRQTPKTDEQIKAQVNAEIKARQDRFKPTKPAK